MSLSVYHQKYANQSDTEMQKRINAKDEELKLIFDQIQLKTASELVKIAVLGCGDKRYVKAHKELFEKYIKKPVKLTTFDISVEHLQGEENITQHDCALPLPNQPYDITFGHVLLKFIETEKQWELLKHSYEALKPGGVAIHIFDSEDYETKSQLLEDGYYSVPLDRWREKLEKENIKYVEISVKYGVALLLIK